MSRKLRIAISGLHLGENCQPGPGVIRSLREAMPGGVEVIGLAYDALDSGLFYPGLLDDAFLVPYPSANPDVYFDRLMEIRATRGLDVLIPNLDVELPVLQYLKREFGAEWYNSAEAGTFLRKIWGLGQSLPAELLAQQFGYDGLDIGPLKEELANALGHPVAAEVK